MPASALVALWMPLLEHLSDLHPTFLSTLAAWIVAKITLVDEATEEETEETINLDEARRATDISYDTCLASWVNWLVRRYGPDGEIHDGHDGRLNTEHLAMAITINLSPLSRASPNKT